jgi:hypothetical protein
LARDVTSPILISETSRARTQFDEVSLNVACMLQRADKPEGWVCQSCPQRLFFHGVLFDLQYWF